MSIHLLLIEDDPTLRATLSETLRVEGFDVQTSASLADAQALLAHRDKQQAFDVILLDLNLPDGDGSALLEHIRRESRGAVIVITARDEDALKIRLLDGGADDYLVKPFSLGELLARIRVTLRHHGTRIEPAVTRYEHAHVTIDLHTRQVTRHGQVVHLTPTEFDLLAQLTRQAGRVLTHRQLLKAVWGASHVEHTHYLRLYMAQLRAKLEDDATRPQLLLTETGVGYRLAV